MKQIKHNQLKVVAEQYSKMGKSLVVFGRTGIGKSYAVKETAKIRAKELGKKFVEWCNLTLEEKKDVVQNPYDKFVFIDIRLTMTSPEDLKGLPDLSQEVTYWKPNMWSYVLSKTSGILFLDEFNLVPPSIQSSVYQILLDKQVGEYPLHKDTYVMCCGNLSEDNAGVYNIAKPIRTRAGFFELKIPSADEWSNYAIDKNLNSNTIMFIQRFKDKIFMESDKTDDVITPRSYEFVSEFTDKITDLEELELCVSGVLGEGVALEYVSFIKLKDKIPRPEDILNKKAPFPKEMDLKFACVSSLTEHFKHKEPKEQVDIVKKIAEIHKDMGEEYFILTLRLFKSVNEDIILGLQDNDEIMENIQKYAKYLRLPKK